MKKHSSAFAVLILLVLVVFAGCSYQPQTNARSDLVSTDLVTVKATSSTIIFEPTVPYTTGIVFYPGGKVNFASYAPLLFSLAEQGIYCVTYHMPLDFAFTGIHKADKAIKAQPELTWYIAGHSLGGAMAAFYAKDAENLTGIIFLAAYSTADLSDSGLKVLTLYGSNDQVLNIQKLKDCTSNLPADQQTIIIEGGNHCQFGDYGFQKGDGTATISAEEQLQQTVTAITRFIR